MADHLEQLVLSGKLFNGGSRSSSPERSPSPDALWPDDGETYSDSSDTTVDRLQQIESALGGEGGAPSIGMGPGRTGVKGVIRDRDEASALARDRNARDAQALARAMEKASLGGKTFLEEEKEREWEKATLEGILGGTPAVLSGKRVGRFGHLREVGMRGFVPAVEEEDRSVWVVVHIYDPSLHRCDALDDTLARLARLHTETKFIRCRASAIGFASTASSRPRRPPSSSYLSRSRVTPDRIGGTVDEDDPYGDITDEKRSEDDDFGEEDEDVVDTDMLPTMLVYRAGDLVHNWVRVDWEAGVAGVGDLLERHHIVAPARSGSSNLGFPSDDEDDLALSGSENGF
ncbi:hypothetical protein HETIRDRAFT_423236 [Heterobasidion irregulare TC 32-1]|uniref:Phosducin domain-containing protein n=1 Tax=Heterobasidion irregulare (strain TC 32-1) TaxID=747525 RepID=W4JQ31_HETIT|nr:uncharacterized protein HETIRDRAFT_423236 [Heterobasidion irregulare TC 32-1]ETW75579.1 hypothetical protein HETIRDRAFT_423236 [Heterobasidion irregulare TC 32-1]